MPQLQEQRHRSPARLDDADQRLATQLEGTARHAQQRARIVRSLSGWLDRLTELTPATAS
ncbi:hypothetical protein SALBM217S_09950 [Streptomyces griseoloalbus]